MCMNLMIYEALSFMTSPVVKHSFKTVLLHLHENQHIITFHKIESNPFHNTAVDLIRKNNRQMIENIFYNFYIVYPILITK